MFRTYFLLFACCSNAWTTTNSVAALLPDSLNKPPTLRSLGRGSGLSATPDDLRDVSSSSTSSASSKATKPSIDNYPVTTKTNKQIVFDDKAGRFFETSIEPQSYHSSSAIVYDYDETVQLSNVNDRREDFFFQMTDDNMNVAMSMTGNVNMRTATTKRILPTAKPSTVSTVAKAATFSNEMVPTEILFGTRSPSVTPTSDDVVGIPMPSDSNDNDRTNRSDEIKSEALPVQPPSAIPARMNVIEQCYSAWNRRDIDGIMACFDDKYFEYQDSQYIGKFTNKGDLQRHFKNQMGLLPSTSQVVLDSVAVDPNSGNIGTRWHVETSTDSGTKKVVPFTRGCSFYTTDPSTGLITSGFRCSEMVIKPNKETVNALLSPLQRRWPSRPSLADSTTRRTYTVKKVEKPDTTKSSIIERYFDAWNKRDMKSAINCFVDDCTYQTEDPVFVETLRGKAELRQHLEKNVDALPSACQIKLDQIAVDHNMATIGATWHLEVAGIAIPNLRGCSMYTIDKSTGLLKTGYDITEAPVKLAKEILSISEITSIPGQLLFGR